jgi:phage replication-related protein YjqB (UPF0714/DUF867 family)
LAVYLGGLDHQRLDILRGTLQQKGFVVETSPNVEGRCLQNICNRCISGRGIQLELTMALRKSLLEKGFGPDNQRLRDFVASVRDAVL